MENVLSLMQRPFRDRVRSPRGWSAVAYVMPRWALALLMALVPALLVLAGGVLGPDELARAITSRDNVQQTFARFISAVATASAIAVSVTTLTLGRELRGLQKQQERSQTAIEFRERVRRAAGRDSLPLSLGGVVGVAAQSARDTARRVRRTATRDELLTRVEGVTLGEYLDVVEAASDATRARLAAVDGAKHPHRLARAALDHEEEVGLRLARWFARQDRLSSEVIALLDDLHARLEDIVTATKYVKTLDTQWGFSRMSLAITVSTVPSIVTAAFMTLAYGDGFEAAFGRAAAVALVAGALFVVVLPLAVFASYIMRFVFLNEHTLPTASFVLGPEERDVVRQERRARSGRGPAA